MIKFFSRIISGIVYVWKTAIDMIKAFFTTVSTIECPSCGHELINNHYYLPSEDFIVSYPVNHVCPSCHKEWTS